MYLHAPFCGNFARRRRPRSACLFFFGKHTQKSDISSKMRVKDSIFWCTDSSSSLVTEGPRRRKKAGLIPSSRIFPRISSSEGAAPPAPVATALSSSARRSADGGGREAPRLLRGGGAASAWPVSADAPVAGRGVGEPRRGCSRAGEGAANSAPGSVPGEARGEAGDIGWSGPSSVTRPAPALAPGPAPAGPWGLAAGVRSGSVGGRPAAGDR